MHGTMSLKKMNSILDNIFRCHISWYKDYILSKFQHYDQRKNEDHITRLFPTSLTSRATVVRPSPEVPPVTSPTTFFNIVRSKGQHRHASVNPNSVTATSSWTFTFDPTRTNVVCSRRVFPSRLNSLDYLRVRQTTTLSQHLSVQAQLASHTHLVKLMIFKSCFNFILTLWPWSWTFNI